MPINENDNLILRLRVNRGEQLAKGEMIGREREVASILRALESHSVQIAAERRIGKTEICREILRMLTVRGITALYEDVESVNSTAELAGVLLSMILSHLGTRQRIAAWLTERYKKFSGGELKLPDQAGGVAFTLPTLLEPHWKAIIGEAISDLIAAKTTGKNPQPFACLCLDEFPIALEKIRAAEGDRTAMDVLDFFRHLRNSNGKSLRFIFTGSIGIHHILRHLRKQKYANDPMNDAPPFLVKALDRSSARKLALGLLSGEGIETPDREAAAECIAERSSYVPFYIHHLVGSLMDDGLPASVENIEATLRSSVESPLDPWHLQNYIVRLERYFPETKLIALALLDMIAVSPSGLDSGALLQRLRVTKGVGKVSDQVAIETLDLLEQDFYIGREGGAQTYHFLRPLLARAWRYRRHLKADAARA